MIWKVQKCLLSCWLLWLDWQVPKWPSAGPPQPLDHTEGHLQPLTHVSSIAAIKRLYLEEKPLKALLQVQHSGLAKHRNCLLVKPVSQCFISSVHRPRGAELWIGLGDVNSPPERAAVSVNFFFLTLLIQLWRSMFCTPLAWLSCKNPLNPSWLHPSVVFISCPACVILCVSRRPAGLLFQAHCYFCCFSKKLVGAFEFGRQPIKAELFLFSRCGHVGTCDGPQILIALVCTF